MLRQFRDPLGLREHNGGVRCLRHVSLQRFPDRRPLPSAGSSWGEFPDFAGTTRRSDSLLPFPSASVVLRPTVPTPCACIRLSLRPDADRGPGALGCGRPAPPWLGVTGSLTFLGNPLASLPGSQTPAGPFLQAITKERHGPRTGNAEDSPQRQPFGAQRQASTLAVFASQLGLLRDHARLASDCGPRSIGWDSTPTGFLRKVSTISSVTSLPPFPGFS